MAVYLEDIVDIELETGTVYRTHLNRSIGEGDIGANRYGVRCFRHGVAFDLTGGACTGYFIRHATGETIVLDGSNGSIDGNVAFVTLPQACYAVEGDFSLAIKVISGDVTGTLRIIDGTVCQTTTETLVDPGTLLPSIEQLLATIEAVVESIPEDYSEAIADIQALEGEVDDLTGDLQTLEDKVRKNNGILLNNTDFDSLTDNGIYAIDSSYTYTHKPPISGGFVFVTEYAVGIVSQLACELDYSQVFVRKSTNGVWTDWGVFNYADLERRCEVHRGILTAESDLNGVDVNTIYGISSGGDYSHNPMYSGILRTMQYNFGQPGYSIQLGYDFDRRLFMRRELNGSWGDWREIGGIPPKGFLGDTTDVDTVRENGLWAIRSTFTGDNWPEIGSGWLYCYEFQSGIYWQNAVSLNGTESLVRYKLFDSAWTAWASQDRKDKDAVYYAFGDSIVYGQIGGVGTQSKYNYPAMAGRMMHMAVQNKAVGGQGLIKDWATINSAIDALSMSDAKLITVGWAYNDSGYYSSMNFGSVSDTGDSTYLGKYYTIMKKLQTKCPGALVILITGYGYPDGTVDPVTKPTLTDQFTHSYTFADGQKTVAEMYGAMEQMANLHGWPCINQAKGTALNQFNAATLIGDQIHPTDDGYYRYGQIIGARIAALYGNAARW